MATIEERNLHYRLDTTLTRVIENLKASASNATARKAEIDSLIGDAAYSKVYVTEEQTEIDNLLVSLQETIDKINTLPNLKR